MKKLLAVLALSALLAGCGTSVKLDEVPVVDKTGTVVNPSGPSAAGSGNTGPASQSAVQSVQLPDGAGDKAGPPGVGRILYFDYDSFAIKPQEQPVIEGNASYIKAVPSRKVVVEGHTDARGGSEYNLALGQKRAETVRRALELLGVSANQVEAVSFGKEKPAVQGSTEEAYAKNRRAEISYR